MARKTSHHIQSLARGLSVLQAFTPERSEMTLTEIARATGMNMSAAQRFTDTLMHMGFLKRDRNKRFQLGPKVLSLGFALLQGSQLKRQAEAFLEEFAQRHHRTVNLAVLDEEDIVFLCRRESQRFLKYDLAAGSKLPAHCTAQGKVLLAGLEDDALQNLLERMPLDKLTSRTITDPRALWGELMEVRRRGYSQCDGELSLDLFTLGAPVINQEGKIVAATNLSLSVEEAKGDLRPKMINSILALGESISATLGYRGPYPLFPGLRERQP